MLNELNTKN